MISSDIEDIMNKETLHNIDYASTKKFVLELIKKNFSSRIEFEKSLKEVSKTCKFIPSKPTILYVYRELIKNKEIDIKPNIENLLKKKVLEVNLEF